MSAAVDRLIEQRIAQGFGEFVSDDVAERCGAILRDRTEDRPWVPPPRVPFRRSAERPPRQMPTTRAIAEHHGMPDRLCWRCGTVGSVERAHLIDRVFAGLDLPCNLALLCADCHRAQPASEPGQEQSALDYITLLGRFS